MARIIDSQGGYPSAVRVLAAAKIALHLAEDVLDKASRGAIVELGWGLTGERETTPSRQ